MPLDQLHESERLKNQQDKISQFRRKKSSGTDNPERLKQHQGEMSFFEHIDELRKRILRAALAIGVVGVVCFLNKDFVFNTLLFGPRNPDFITYKVLCQISQQTGLGDKFCFTPPKFDIITRQLGEVLMQHLFVSFWLGLIGAFPLVFLEFWRFVRPGLLENEQSAVRGLVGICSFLFILGVCFGYFIIAPFSISFLASYTLENTQVSPTLDSYVTYMTMFTIPTGVIFEMPVVAYFLAKIGILGAAFMRTYRRHAAVVIIIVAAIITPPDVVSLTIVSIPLLILYEISIVVVKRVQIQREKLINLQQPVI